MHIERVQIEEGFLNGLDVQFVPGLNVVIGARGTGKTSLIELIRFCLDVGGYTPEVTKKSRDHALSVLGSGQITVTLVEAGRQITVSRSGAEASNRSSGPFSAPIILSQTEIETVGLQPGGRLRLLDGFVGDMRSFVTSETESVAAVHSLTAEATAIRLELDELMRQLAELPAIEAQLAALMPEEQKLQALSTDVAHRTQHLTHLSETITAKGVATAVTERMHQAIQRWRASLSHLQANGPISEPWPPNGGADPLGHARTQIGTAYAHLQHAHAALHDAELGSTSILATLASEKVALEDQARHLRRDIEQIQAGSGAIIRQGQTLREHKARLESLGHLYQARSAALATVIQRRSQALDSLEAVRAQRHVARVHAAVALNAVLGPRIQISVLRAGQYDAFSAAIAEALKGSGLRYNDLATSLSQRMSPRELLEAVENNDFDLLARCAGVTADRANKVLVSLKEANLGALATVTVEDWVSFSLLDGPNYKDISDLSTGQRCTVILPLVLRHSERLLIVDQPEDHIDNAFIVDTLIQSVLARSAGGQILFSTHNANIPVLGNANRVMQLGSDGRRGYVLTAADLDAPDTVQAITTVMEGGADAFARRAHFYGRHVGR